MLSRDTSVNEFLWCDDMVLFFEKDNGCEVREH